MGWVSHDCKVDLGTIRGNLTGDQFIRDILQPVVPHFDSHSLARRPVYGWQRQATSFKGSNSLPSKWSCDCSYMASHEPGFESDRACLGLSRPSCTGIWTSCTELTSIGSSMASGMAVATTAGHPTTDWRDETEGWERHPSTWWVHSILNFEPWMSLRDSKFTLSRGNANLIVHYKLWMSILKFDIF